MNDLLHTLFRVTPLPERRCTAVRSKNATQWRPENQDYREQSPVER
jgi:hypothetical protein